MAGLDPAIHASLPSLKEDVDARHRARRDNIRV